MEDEFVKKLHKEARNPQRERSIAWWSHRVSMAFKTRMEEYAEEFDMPMLEVVLLVHLTEIGPSTLVELSKLMQHTHPAVLRHLDNLEERGLLQRSPHESDRRIKVISLTDKGKELVPKLYGLFQKVHVHALEGVPEEHQHITLSTLQQMHKNMGGEDFHSEVMKAHSMKECE